LLTPDSSVGVLPALLLQFEHELAFNENIKAGVYFFIVGEMTVAFVIGRYFNFLDSNNVELC
jgi:hypothetical protein